MTESLRTTTRSTDVSKGTRVLSALPVDPEIESLQAVLDPKVMLGVLRDVLGGSAARPPASVDVDVLRHRPGRRHAVVEYHLLADDGSELGVCVGKVFKNVRRAKRLQRVLDATHRHLGAHTPVPVPLALVEEYSLVLMRKLEGELLAPILIHGGAGAEVASRLVARSLAALHSVPIEEGKASSLDEELASARNKDPYRQIAPALVAEGEQLLADIEERAAALPGPGAPTLIHGSFRPNEVLVGDGRASIVDLDGWALGDPALDLGYNLADTWWEESKTGEKITHPWAERLLEQYIEEADSPGLRERARLYETFSLTRMMLKKVRSLGKKSAEKRAKKWTKYLGQAELLRDRARTRLPLAR